MSEEIGNSRASDAPPPPAEVLQGEAVAGGDEQAPVPGKDPKAYDPDELEQYVRERTRIADEKAKQGQIAFVKEEKGAEGSLERSLMDGDDFKTEIRETGVAPESFTTGRWYKFLNFSGSCFVYVHNLTRDITAVRPENYHEPSAEELERERKKGLPLTLLIPNELDKIYNQKKKIPLVYCTEETQEKIRKFCEYGRGHVVETGLLKRVSEFGMERARTAIVNAMRYGMYLVIEIPLHVCDFREKICARKWEPYFPIEIFDYKGCDENNPVKKKIYRPEDMEANNQCVVRKGFQVVVTLCYDNQNYQMSSMRLDDCRSKIPNFELMEVIRCRG